MPAELSEHANLKRFKELEKSERERAIYKDLENWMFPPAPNHLDAPRASIRAIATPVVDKSNSGLHLLKIEFVIRRPRTGDRKKSLANLVDLTVRAAHEKELFPPRIGNSLNGLPNNTLKKPGKVIYSFQVKNYFNGLLTGDLNHVCNLILINLNTIFLDNWRS